MKSKNRLLRYTHALLLLLGSHPCVSLSFKPFSTVLSNAEPTVNGSKDKFEPTANGSRDTFETKENKPRLSAWTEFAGDNALRQVTFLASKVAESTAAAEVGGTQIYDECVNVAGTGGVVYNNANFNKGVQNLGRTSNIPRPNTQVTSNSKREDQVWTALANLELDSKFYHSFHLLQFWIS